MKKVYTSTGEMAKIHGINKKTLIYYDEIDLFHPSFRNEKGYRFYEFSQHSILEIILSLRLMDVPISEIRAYINKRSPSHLIELLEDKKSIVKEKIKKLKAIDTLLENKLKAINSYKNSEEITLVDCEEERLMVMGSPQTSVEEDLLQLISNRVETCDEGHLYSNTWGSLMALSDLENHDFNTYSHVYTKSLKDAHSKVSFVKPKGTYLQMYYQGNWASFETAYLKILAYIKEKALQLTGYVYEENIIDDFATENDDLYVTKIMIKVL